METQELEVKPDTPVVELEDGGLQVGEAKEAKEPGAEDDGDARLTGEHEDDEQGHAEETVEEADARRERNRQRRQQNKENRKNYIESLRRELSARDQIINDLSTRVASVEQQSVGSQMAQLDAAIDEAGRYYNHFKEVNRIAIEQADGAKAVEAQEKMFAAQQRYNMLSNAKKNMAKPAQQSPALDPRVISNAQDWMARNEWYDQSRSDQDSYLVGKLDDRLVQEGWNPATKEYWEELDARIKKYLPHKVVSGYNSHKSGQSANTRPRVPVAGSGSESNSGSKGGYILSAERVKALKEAGVYDDPVARADAIRRFQEFDRQNGQSK